MTLEELKSKTISMRTGETKMRRDREYWSDEERQKMQVLFAEGVSVNEIAITLERSEAAVYQQIERMKLYARNPFTTRRRTSSTKEAVCLCETCTCDRTLCPRCKAYDTILEGM